MTAAKGVKALFAAALLLLTLLSVSAQAQPSYVYNGRTWSPSEIICNIWNGVLIEGENQDYSMAVVRTDGQYIYSGRSNSTFDILYTIRDNKIFKGQSNFLGDVVCTLEGNHIYRGNSTFALDMAYTYRDGYIFEGDGVSTLDVVFTTNPSLRSMQEVAMFLLAMDLL